MKKLLPIFFMLCATSCMTACDDDQDIEKGNTNNQTDPGTDGQATVNGMINLTLHIMENGQDKGSDNVTNYKDKIVTVASGDEQIDGVRVSTYIQTVLGLSDSELDAYLNKYVCEYQSNIDGFKPSDKGDGKKCPLVSCTNTKHAYINAETGGIFYDEEAATQQGCYRVKMISDQESSKSDRNFQANILVLTPIENAEPVEDGGDNNNQQTGDNTEIASYTISVIIDGETVSVDIATLSDKITEVGDSKGLMLSDIIKAAKDDIDLNEVWCDYASGDFHSSKKADCAISKCTNSNNIFFNIDNINEHNASVAGGLPGCFGVKGLDTIEIFATEPEAK